MYFSTVDNNKKTHIYEKDYFKSFNFLRLIEGTIYER